MRNVQINWAAGRSSGFRLKNKKGEENEDCWVVGLTIAGEGRLLLSIEPRATATLPVASLARSKKQKTKGSRLPVTEP